MSNNCNHLNSNCPSETIITKYQRPLSFLGVNSLLRHLLVCELNLPHYKIYENNNNLRELNSLPVPEREKAISDWEKFFDLKMKCKQRLCQRNKNLRISGYCSICDNLAEEIKKKYADKEKPNIDILIEKLQEVEVENLTNKIRLEALENWASTITESLNQMKARNDAPATEDVDEESDSNSLRDEPLNKPSTIRCKICKESFSKNLKNTW